ncbi:MAG: AraC family transcriptional regulator [bacterium]|nr:AraC family transcriptional regulator [bacterium]
MQNFEEIYRAIKYIEENLKESFSVEDVARAAGYSLYHFIRTFNAAIGHSPYDYIMRRRLSEAAKDLIDSEQKIIDIAYDYRFNNPETFSRAFRKMFGHLPNKVRKNRSLRNLVFKSQVTREYITHINKGNYLKPRFVEMDKLFLVGMVSLVRENLSVIPELREKLKIEIPFIKNRVIPEKQYSLSFYPANWDMEGYFFMTGVEVHSLDDIPPLLVAKEIPSLKYANFTHKGGSKDLGMTLDYIYQTWLPKSGNRIAASFEMEHFGPKFRGLENSISERDILIPVE